ncbi:MAG: CBS domain-containing protein [Acetobacterales bacterium]
MKVRQILGGKGGTLITTAPDATVADVTGVLREHRIGAIPVVDDGGRLVGIISERDIVRALPVRGATLLDVRVSELMTRNVQTCEPDELIDTVMERMTTGRFRHLPVLEEGALVGIVSIGDVVKSRLEELRTERDALSAYIR